MIIIPKYKDFELLLPAYNVGISGEFKLVLRNSMGGIVEERDWSSNILTNFGRNTMGGWTGGSGSTISYGYVGSSATPPAVTDTQMGAQLGSAALDFNDYGYKFFTIVGAPDYQRYMDAHFRFNAGVGTGTIREVGTGTSSSSTGVLCFHHAVSPAIVKSSDQVLDLYHRCTLWPKVTDTLGTVTLDGVQYDTIVRPALISTAYNCPTHYYNYGPGGSGNNYVRDGELGAITGTPAGGGDGNFLTYTPEAYVDSSYYKDVTADWDLDGGNTPLGGIRSTLGGTVWGAMIQTRFGASAGDARIPKDNTKILWLRWRTAWDRH